MNLVEFLLNSLNFDDAVHYSRKMITILQAIKNDKLQKQSNNQDEMNKLDERLFCTYYRMTNCLKKSLILRGNSDREE